MKLTTEFISFSASLRFIFLCRHIVNSQNIFLKWEQRILKKLHAKYARLPLGRTLAPKEFTRENFDPKIIKSMPRRGTQPIVIRGFARPDLLTLDELKSDFGEGMVPVHPKADLAPDAIYNIVTQRKLRDVIEDIEASKSTYTVAATDIFKKFKSLAERTLSPQIEAFADVEVIKNELFVGARKTGSNFHCAPADNYFLMIQGRKLWRLVDPRNSMAMYPTIGRLREAPARNSPISVHHYDREQYPLFEKVDMYEVTLEPGDLLYNPTMWWHEVENLDVTIGAPHRVAPRSRYDFMGLLIMLRVRTLEFYASSFLSLFKSNSENPIDLTDSQIMSAYGGEQKREL